MKILPLVTAKAFDDCAAGELIRYEAAADSTGALGIVAVDRALKYLVALAEERTIPTPCFQRRNPGIVVSHGTNYEIRVDLNSAEFGTGSRRNGNAILVEDRWLIVVHPIQYAGSGLMPMILDPMRGEFVGWSTASDVRVHFSSWSIAVPALGEDPTKMETLCTISSASPRP